MSSITGVFVERDERNKPPHQGSTGEHTSPLRLEYLSMIKNPHPNRCLPTFIVGQGLAPAVRCGI